MTSKTITFSVARRKITFNFSVYPFMANVRKYLILAFSSFMKKGENPELATLIGSEAVNFYRHL